MLKFGWILVYLKYWTLNLMPLKVYPKILFGVNIHRYIQSLAFGAPTLPGISWQQAVICDLASGPAKWH